MFKAGRGIRGLPGGGPSAADGSGADTRSTGKYGLDGRLEYLDCDSGITAHVFARNADMLVDCEGYGNSVQTPEAAIRCGEAGGCFFCLH